LLAAIEPTDFFQGISLLHTYTMRSADLAAGKAGKQATGVSAKRETVLSLPLSAYQEWKERLVKGFWNAARFLRKEAFFSPRDLPYRTQLVPLATLLALLGERWLEQRVYDKLARWYWCGVIGELYGGAVETRIALDLQEFMQWLESDSAVPATVRDANFQPGRLDTLRSRNSAAYKGISVLIQRNGAQDWFWKSTIRDLDENDWEESQLDIHHIFPRDWCEKRSIEPKRYNSILNKTPISYKANRMIGGKAPSDYLAQLQGHRSVMLNAEGIDSLLRTHLIDPEPLRANDFQRFVDTRRQQMIHLISRAMGKDLISTEEAYPDEEDDDEVASIVAREPGSNTIDLEDDDNDEDDDDGDDTSLGEAKIENVRTRLMPALLGLGLKYRLRKNQKGLTVKVGDYRLSIGARKSNKFTFYVFSRIKTHEQALADFPGTELPEYRTDKPLEGQYKLAVMGMADLQDIVDAIGSYMAKK